MGWRDTVKPIETGQAQQQEPARKSWRDTIKPIETSPKEEKSFLQKAGEEVLGTVVEVGQAIDSVTGAPTRAAISAVQKGQGASGALRGFIDQFGGDPSKAPTGAKIAEQAGVSTKSYGDRLKELEPKGLSKDSPFRLPEPVKGASPADVVGLGIDILADPTNLIPGSLIAKGAAKGVKAGAKLAGKAALTAGKVAISPFAEKTAVKVAGNIAKGSKLAFDKLFNPKVSESYEELAAIARKNGIDPDTLPESIEFGENSLISRAARTQREGILGEVGAEAFQDSLRNVRDVTDAKIAEIGRGTVLDPVEAGNFIRQSYDEAFDEFFSTIDTSYNQVVRQYPGLRITGSSAEKLNSALNGIEKFAKGRVSRGIHKIHSVQGTSLLNAVKAIRNGNGSLKQTVEALHDIGETAFKPQNTLAAIPADVQRMRKLYGDITEAIHETIKRDVPNGESISGALRINNQRMSQFFGDKSALEKVIGNRNVAPENVFKSLIMSGDTRKIQALKNILGPERMQQLKASALDSLIKRTDEQDFSFRQLRNAMRNKQTVLKELLAPDEAKEISELVRLGDAFGLQNLSTSGSSAGNTIRGLKENIGDAVFNEAFVEGMKNRARSSLRAPQAPAVKPSIFDQASKIPFQRNKADAAAKALQVTGAQSNDRDRKRQNAFERRLGR